MEGSTTLKSYLEQNHSFLKNVVSFSPEDLLERITEFDLYDIKHEDKQIIEKIIEHINSTNTMPIWWSEQESSYLKKISSHEQTIKYLIFRYKFRTYPMQMVPTKFPIYVLLEPVSACNLRCPFCFQTDPDFTRKPYAGIMDMNLFKRVIDECEQNGTGAITLASRGEPTLHPKFTEMLDYAANKFFELKINTNGTRLTEKLCHSIFKNGVNDVVLSIDTEQKELFEKLRKHANFDEVVQNVQNLYRIREEFYPDSNTAIRISGVYCGPDQDNEKFSQFWGQWSDEITIAEVEERWDTYKNPIQPDFSTPCQNVWERFYVWWDGVCNPCDVDYKSELSPGTLNDSNSIKDIWNSKVYKLLRLNHENGMRSGCFPCDRCGVS
tara:strand:+ start:6207 stop:7349 length:1143 start_codon:yes stop_codon:yes gene_type:complete